jgi:hypothetical protein
MLASLERSVPVRVAAVLLLLLAVAYLGSKVFEDSDTVDFKFIYLAGDLWLEGQNPYSEVYAARGEQDFPGLNRPGYLLYPPHWWSIATASALIPYETALVAWRIACALCLLGGCAALHATGRALAAPFLPARTVLVLVLAMSMSATAIAISLGQTSCLLFLGISLYTLAYVRQQRVLMVLALVIVMLKPNVGMALSLFLVPSLAWWPSLAVAAAVVLAASLPALLPFGVVEVLRGYLAALAEWEALPTNAAHSTTGVRNAAHLLFGAAVPGGLLALAGFAAAALIGLAARLSPLRGSEARHRAAWLCLLVVTVALLVPLHTYDLMFLLPVVPLSASLPAAAEAFVLLLFLPLWRPNNLATLIGLADPESRFFPETMVATMTIFAMAAGVAAGLARGGRSRGVGL